MLILNGGGDGLLVQNARKVLNDNIDSTKKILYVPLAWIEDSTYDSCLEFMINELSDIDCIGIEMIRSGEELFNKNLSDYAGIYIGGDKIKSYILNENGVVYGGSAGAIIFGHDLDSCNTDDSNDVNLKDNTAFDMLNGYSLLCHYTNRDPERTEISKKYLLELSKIKPIYAIPEEDTIIVDKGELLFIGTKPYFEFIDGKIIEHYIKNVKKL